MLGLLFSVLHRINEMMSHFIRPAS